MEYIISSPVGQLTLIVAEKSRDFMNDKDVNSIINEASKFVTTDANIPFESIDMQVNKLIEKIIDNKNYQKVISSFLSIYYREIGNDTFSKYFGNIVVNMQSVSYEIQSMFDKGLICGLFASCLMNDKFINKGEININIPKTVKDAMKYIESEGFKVHLDEKK